MANKCPKYVQLSLFAFDDGSSGVFKIIPEAAHEGNLRDLIELCGGVVLEPGEDDLYAVTLIDVEWVSSKGLDRFSFRCGRTSPDLFLSTFLYDCYEWERAFDLNQYRFGDSKYLPYDANEVLARRISWSELRRQPIEEAPSVESSRSLYETPQKRHRLEQPSESDLERVGSSVGGDGLNSPINSHGEDEDSDLTQAITADEAGMDSSLTPVSVEIEQDEELVLRRIQSEEENEDDDIVELESPEKEPRASKAVPTQKRNQAATKARPTKRASKNSTTTKARPRRTSSSKSNITKDSDNTQASSGNSPTIPVEELSNGAEVEVQMVVTTPGPSTPKREESKKKSPQMVKKHVTTRARNASLETQSIVTNGEPPTHSKKSRKSKKNLKFPEPVQLDADVEMSDTEVNNCESSAHTSKAEESRTEVVYAERSPVTKMNENAMKSNSGRSVDSKDSAYSSQASSQGDVKSSSKNKRKRPKSGSDSLTAPDESTPQSLDTPAETPETPAEPKKKKTKKSRTISTNESILSTESFSNQPSSLNGTSLDPNSSNLSIKDSTSAENYYTCSSCPFKTAVEYNLVYHMRQHTGDQRFRCPYCNFFGEDKSGLTQHKKQHIRGELLCCLKCNFTTADGPELASHSKSHEGVRTYECPSCDYKATTAYKLRIHKMSHMNENGN